MSYTFLRNKSKTKRIYRVSDVSLSLSLSLPKINQKGKIIVYFKFSLFYQFFHSKKLFIMRALTR